jgi:hypothetical protein
MGNSVALEKFPLSNVPIDPPLEIFLSPMRSIANLRCRSFIRCSHSSIHINNAVEIEINSYVSNSGTVFVACLGAAELFTWHCKEPFHYWQGSCLYEHGRLIGRLFHTQWTPTFRFKYSSNRPDLILAWDSQMTCAIVSIGEVVHGGIPVAHFQRTDHTTIIADIANGVDLAFVVFMMIAWRTILMSGIYADPQSTF